MNGLPKLAVSVRISPDIRRLFRNSEKCLQAYSFRNSQRSELLVNMIPPSTGLYDLVRPHETTHRYELLLILEPTFTFFKHGVKL